MAAAPLGYDGEIGGDRSRGALIYVGNPKMEGHEEKRTDYRRSRRQGYNERMRLMEPPATAMPMGRSRASPQGHRQS